MRYTIEVTEDDIVNGDPHDPCSCPIARAISRATGKNWYQVDVRGSGLKLSNREGKMQRVTGPLPRIARDFIERFDRGSDVQPITFTLGIRTKPTEVTR